MFKIRECKKLMKKCKTCGELKFISDFYKDNGKKDGYKTQCKTCIYSKAKLKHSLVCLECGKEFTTKNKKQKFCSIECKNNHNNKEILCDYCGKSIKIPKFKIKKSDYHFCSTECHYKWNSSNNTEEVLCDYCGKSIKLIKSKIKKSVHHFCSRECMRKWNLGKNNPNYNSEEVLCDYCGKLIKLKKSRIERSDYHFCSNECHSKWNSENRKGENHYNWNPNLTDEDRQDRRLIEGYNDCRKQVFERDNYTCQITGIKGGKLVMHHLNSYNSDKEHRTDVNNCITLLKEVHKLFHKEYGYGNNTKEQFEEFKHRYHNGEFKEVI